MNATFNQHTANEGHSFSLADEPDSQSMSANETAVSTVQTLNFSPQMFLPSRIITHNPKAGLNPIVDAASYLFSVTGKLKSIKSYRQLNKLQTELVQEINTYQEAIKNHGYSSEYIIVCRYILCATIDEIISNTSWGSQGQWDAHSLLAAFNLDMQHQDKFFTIMERAIKEPALYIDLMELMYICLSLGYKGQYRTTEHNHYLLEQITNNLYKNIRAYRGSFSKTLSPMPLKALEIYAKSVLQRKTSLSFILIVTACVIMAVFVSLGYLMDVTSNEVYKNISQFENPTTHETA